MPLSEQTTFLGFSSGGPGRRVIAIEKLGQQHVLIKRQVFGAFRVLLFRAEGLGLRKYEMGFRCRMQA